MSHFPADPTGQAASFSHHIPEGALPVSPSDELNRVAAETHSNHMAERMLTDLNNVRFRMSRRSSAGYHVAVVDELVDQLEVKVRARESILATIQGVRFPMASRREGGYDVLDVDAFLDHLEHLAGEQGDALSVPAAPLLETQAPWLRASNPVLWLVVLGVVAVIVLYFL